MRVSFNWQRLHGFWDMAADNPENMSVSFHCKPNKEPILHTFAYNQGEGSWAGTRDPGDRREMRYVASYPRGVFSKLLSWS